jgi:hypothetical protein
MAENTRRGILPQVIAAKSKAKTHCKRNHPLFGENMNIDKDGHRGCKVCQRMKADEWRIRNQKIVNEKQRIRRAKERS